jgi:glycosyltransferase involved in cell wall biosynthesis
VNETIFAWPISSYHGWGVRGLGYALNMEGTVVSASPELTAELPPDDPRWPILAKRLEESRKAAPFIAQTARVGDTAGAAVLVPLGNDLAPPLVYGGKLKGTPTIACPVFENVEMVEANVGKLKGYDRIVVASRWNQEVLGSLGIEGTLCHEGIDPAVFNPGVRAEAVRKRSSDGTASRFRVFAGGKVEWRKGQDIVIEAFKLFAEKHDDAVLVAAWGSPFGAQPDFDGKWEHGSPPGWHIGRPNFHAWTQRAGIKPHQFEYVESRANWRMAEVYGGVDVAVFPNRCEGGTNFVAMEAMACGVPTVVRAEYGQADLRHPSIELVSRDHSMTVDHLCAAMQDVRDDRVGTAPLDEYWTWERHCRQMAEIIAGV